MTLWKILVGDKDSTTLHGVTLREDIKKLALKQKILGQIRNIKNTGQVEIVCVSDSKPIGFFQDISNEIRNNDLILEPISIDMQDIKISDLENHIKESKTFKIIREDELTEMMWALRYAGAAVLSQELIRGKNIIRTLLAELVANQLMLDNEHDIELNTIAVESMIRQPYEKIDHSTLLSLQRIHILCKNVNRHTNQEDGIKMDLIAELKSEIENILIVLRALAKKMRINIPESNNNRGLI